ncbi:carotenoid biosynthesis protein [Microbispora sp. NPDC046933]|uniref:carotenoid biosynthesis protein n=1 Tax=Microbispora sp. NPDC046933 TaxID=3155618 RepID=UPI00340ABA3E
METWDTTAKGAAETDGTLPGRRGSRPDEPRPRLPRLISARLISARLISTRLIRALLPEGWPSGGWLPAGCPGGPRPSGRPVTGTSANAPRLGGAWLNAIGVVALAAMVAAQIATGLRPRDPRLTTVVVVLLAVTALAFAAAAYTPRRAAGAFAAAVAAGYAAEWIGTRTGLPFGDYRYTDALWPRPGGVPLIVALAWGGMGLAAHAVARRVAPRGRLTPILTGALALTAWDLFLDPQMLRLGLWVWAEPGPYRGVPLGNFAGWLLVSLLVMVLADRLTGERPGHSAAGRSVPGRPVSGVEAAGRGACGGGGRVAGTPGTTGLAALYTVMAAMETLGFAVVFRPPDPFVAAAGGLAMGAFALLAWGRAWRR